MASSFSHVMIIKCLKSGIENGDLEEVQKVLTKFPDQVNVQFYWNNRTSLYRSYFTHFTPLHLAAIEGHSEIVRYLLSFPDINVNTRAQVREQSLENALGIAVLKEHAEIVKLLLQHPKIDVNSKNMHGYTVLTLNTSRIPREILKLLIQHPSLEGINDKDEFGVSALKVAAACGYEDIVELLLQNPRIDINVKDNCGVTPLITAITSDRPNIAQLLMKSPRLDVNIRDVLFGYSALMWASMKRYPAVVGLLLQHPDIDVNVKSKENKSALDYAAGRKCINVIELLLSHPKCIVDPYDITIWSRLIPTYNAAPTWWVDCPSYVKSLYIHRRDILTRYPALKDPAIRDVLQAKLYSISRRSFLQLYRTLELPLDNNTLDIILQYLFGSARRVLETGKEGCLEIITGNYILSEADFDAFLQYELY